MLLALLAVIASLFALWRIGRRTRFFLHVVQLEGYKPNEVRAWLTARLGTHVWRWSHIVGAAVLAISALGLGRVPGVAMGLACAAWAVAFASSKLYRSVPVKKPLAWTARMLRLTLATGALALVPVVVGALFGRGVGGAAGLWPWLAGLWVADVGAPLWAYLASLGMKPVEAGIQEGFKRQARATLAARPDLKVVAITGSYGKTSTKFVVAELLGQRFNVLATPSSYNTPMGISLIVNNELRPDHQVLVLEMGMRYPGDIAELCGIARPDVAVVTSVGVAHLETMGTVEAIAREKASLLREMKPGGTAILNADDAFVREMTGVQGATLRVSLDGGAGEITGRDVRYGPAGMTLTVRDETGEEAVFTTKLLGAHNALNVLLGVAVGRAFGIRLRALAQAAARIEPVPHRLALRVEHGVTILDDAFNANPVGARSAAEVLGGFTGGRRVVVTPGMVELGARQEAENFAFGETLARHADLVVLVNERQTQPIREGLRAAGYPDAQVHVAPGLYAAQDFLKTWLRPGDTVLYENDLPDQYG